MSSCTRSLPHSKRMFGLYVVTLQEDLRVPGFQRYIQGYIGYIEYKGTCTPHIGYTAMD